MKDILVDPIFDARTAEGIFKIVLESGGNLHLHLRGIKRALPEGIRLLKERLDSDSKIVRVEMTGIEESLLVLFQIYGFVVANGSVMYNGGELQQVKNVPGLIVAVCKKCETSVHLYEPGNFICPACGARLYADRAGRTVYYEPLQPYHP